MIDTHNQLDQQKQSDDLELQIREGLNNLMAMTSDLEDNLMDIENDLVESIGETFQQKFLDKFKDIKEKMNNLTIDFQASVGEIQ